MERPKDQTFITKILENWSMPTLRFAFPTQLRPELGVASASPLVIALDELRSISGGQVELLRALLRNTVRQQHIKSKALEEVAVTTTEAQKVRIWLVAQLGEKEDKQLLPRISNDLDTTGRDKPTVPSGKNHGRATTTIDDSESRL